MKSVFISSTFKDMQAERDYLHERVFPRIQRQLQASGETIQELDLRWGVDTSNMTEEESGKQVLKVCIDAIDRCKPYTIVLLGERYGWIPEITVVKEANDTRVNEHYQENMSITNLEIRYAALDDEELMSRCIFCFRSPAMLEDMEETDRRIYDAESPMHRERLNCLKEEIRKSPGVTIIDYEASWDRESHRVTGIEELGEKIYTQLSERILRETAGTKPCTPEEQVVSETTYLMERYLSSYIQRGQEEYAVLYQLLQYQMEQWHYIKQQHGRQTWSDVCVCGAAGSGKSALMAACAKRLMDNDEKVMLYFCGAPGCQDQNMMKRMLVYHLEKFLYLKPGSTAGSYEERLGELNGRLENRQVFCFLDGVDQMFAEGEELYLDVLDRCPQVCFVLSVVRKFPIEDLLKKSDRKVTRVEVGGLEIFQARQLIGETTKRRGKKLDDELVNDILAKKGAENPLYLSLILQRFFMMDGGEFQLAEAMAPGMEGLHLYMEKLLADMPKETEALIQQVLVTTGTRFGEGEFGEILKLLAVSKGGLTEQELEAAFALAERPFSQLRFQQIVSYLYDFFQQMTDGKWEFRHRLFRESMLAWPGIGEARQILISLALCDVSFMEREGYAYILDAHIPEGAKVLEQAKSFSREEVVYNYVAGMLKQGEEAYFAAMLEREPSEGMVDFWLNFPGRDYGSVYEEIQGRMLKKFLKHGHYNVQQISEICVRLSEKAFRVSDSSELEQYLAWGEEIAAELAEPKKSLLLARLTFWRAGSLWQQNTKDAVELYRQAGDFAAAALYGAEGRCLEDAVYWRIRARSAWILDSWRQKKELLIREAEAESVFLEEQQKLISEEVYANCRMRLLSCRMELLREEDISKEQKKEQADSYRESGIRITESFPTVQNLKFLYEILENIRRMTPISKQYRVCWEQIHYSRRLVERRGTQGDQYELMNALLLYAVRADHVLMESPSVEVKEEIGTRSKECWEEGFTLLETLRDNGYRYLRPLWDVAYFYGKYCLCRIELDIDEAAYPKIFTCAGKVIELYQEMKLSENSPGYYDWNNCARDAHLCAGVLHHKLHETKEALWHLTKARDLAWKAISQEWNGDNLVKYLSIHKWQMVALYRDRQGEKALEAAGELDRLLTDWQVIGGEEYKIELLYIQGRVAFEGKDLKMAALRAQQLEPYMHLMKKKLLGSSCLLLKMDVACAGGNLQEAKEIWAEAERWLKRLYDNKWMQEHMHALTAEIRFYLEYGYERYVKLSEKAGNPISEEAQKLWREALDAPATDRVKERRAEKEAERRANEPEKAEWRDACQSGWKKIEPTFGQESVEQLQAFLELYGKQVNEDRQYDTLAYELREVRWKLARELYLRTGEMQYVDNYVIETDQLVTKLLNGKETFLDTGISISDRGNDWEECIWKLLKSLYEETGSVSWLTEMMTYLEQAVKRKNWVRIKWYEEVFADLEAHLTDERERLQKLRQRRYELEVQRTMFEFLIARNKV